LAAILALSQSGGCGEATMSPVGEYPSFGLDFLLSRKYGKKSRRNKKKSL